MICLLPRNAGFCAGVAAAVGAAFKLCAGEFDKNGENGAFMLGEAAHNPAVVDDLRRKGLGLLREAEDAPDGACVLIRAHGVGAGVLETLRRKGCDVVDKTCPSVKKIHGIAAAETAEGRDLLIIGEPDHPEVVGIAGWAAPSAAVYIARDSAAVEAIAASSAFERGLLSVVAQTTFDHARFGAIRALLAELVPTARVFDTVCRATSLRQEELRLNAPRADAAVVVGGAKSSNVAKLCEIAASSGCVVQLVPNASGIDFSRLAGGKTVILVSGASTPIKDAEDCADALREFCVGVGEPFAVEKL